ncbi:MAG: NADH:flavin oxidoreductase [Thermodesulfobacteriota bacterium]
MADIFTPWSLGGLTIPNRLVRSATWEGMAADDGSPSFDSINLTADLAAGGVGLVITGYAFVRPEGRGLVRQTGAHIDAMIGPLARMSDAVHKMGGLVALQIVHAGGQTNHEWIGQPPVGPSAILHPAFNEQVRELTSDEIWDIVEAFAKAAARAKAAGFDAVELHGAHGYLINQFLSPNTNLRADDWGGSLENRARFGLEVYQACRQAVGPRYPLFIKLNSHDHYPGGLELDEAVQVAAWLGAAGIDAIEVSGGVPAERKAGSARVVKGPEDEGYFLANAKAVKAVVDCPVISVGGWRSRARIEAALDQVDAVSLSRPFIRQPHLANYWKQGGDQPAACISCNLCFLVGRKQGIACGQELKAQGKEI